MDEAQPRDQDPLRAWGRREGYLRVQLRLLTAAEGGRRSGIADGYRASWTFEAERQTEPLVVHDAPLLIEGGPQLSTGAAAVVRIHPLHPEFWTRVEAGHRMTMREGTRIVGEAVVVEKVGPDATRE